MKRSKRERQKTVALEEERARHSYCNEEGGNQQTTTPKGRKGEAHIQ